MGADDWNATGNWSETLSREQQSLFHGALWFAVVSLTAFSAHRDELVSKHSLLEP